MCERIRVKSEKMESVQIRGLLTLLFDSAGADSAVVEPDRRCRLEIF